MNTKNKIIAILMAGIVAMATGVPMAIGSVTTSASVGDVAPLRVHCNRNYCIRSGFEWTSRF